MAWYDTATPVPILPGSVTLSHAEILTWHTTPKVLVTAQGPGSIIIPHGPISIQSFLVADYTDIQDGSYITPTYDGTELFEYLLNLVADTRSEVSSLLASGTAGNGFLVRYGQPQAVSESWGRPPLNGNLTDLANLPLTLVFDNGGIPLDDGNAANEVQVHFEYSVRRIT